MSGNRPLLGLSEKQQGEQETQQQAGVKHRLCAFTGQKASELTKMGEVAWEPPRRPLALLEPLLGLQHTSHYENTRAAWLLWVRG